MSLAKNDWNHLGFGLHKSFRPNVNKSEQSEHEIQKALVGGVKNLIKDMTGVEKQVDSSNGNELIILYEKVTGFCWAVLPIIKGIIT